MSERTFYSIDEAKAFVKSVGLTYGKVHRSSMTTLDCSTDLLDENGDVFAVEVVKFAHRGGFSVECPSWRDLPVVVTMYRVWA